MTRDERKYRSDQPFMHSANLTKRAQKASEYFRRAGVRLDSQMSPNISDSSGLVTYIDATTNPPPPEILALYNQVSPVMEGLTNVVTSAVIHQASGGNINAATQQAWLGPTEAMAQAFCGGLSLQTQSLNRTVTGIQVAEEVINVIIDAVVSSGTAAFAEFTSFLQGQGAAISANVTQGAASYQYGAVSIVHTINQDEDGTVHYIPTFNFYFTQFNQTTLQLTSSCGSAQSFQFVFALDILTGAFLVDEFQADPQFQVKVQNFINEFQQTNIANSTNYFKGIFDSMPASNSLRGRG
jgi:hypothetical protein